MNRVLANAKYFTAIIVGTLCLFFLIEEYGDFPLLFRLWSDANLSSTEALEFSRELIFTTARVSDVLYSFLLAAFITLNATMFFYFFKRRLTLPRSIGIAGTGGAILTLLGFGCAACGSLVIGALVTSAGASFIASLPFEGFELRVLGLVLLAVSIYFLHRAINNPLVCRQG